MALILVFSVAALNRIVSLRQPRHIFKSDSVAANGAAF